jgi:hypothetical protein
MQTALKPAALLAVLTLAACGGSNTSQPGTGSTMAPQALPKAAYSVELQQVGTSLVSALNTFGKKFSSFNRIEAGVGRGQAALNQAARRLAAITPPANARSDNAKLISGMRSFASQLMDLKTAASRHSLKAVIAADRSLDRSPAVKVMMAAAADLQREGYKLGQLAPSGKD